MKVSASILWCILLIVSVVVGSKKYEALKRSLASLEQASTFYSQNYDQVNLDSIFGLRSAEGTLHNLLQNHEAYFLKYPAALETLKKVLQSIQDTSQRAYQHFENQNEPYFQKFKGIIHKRWYYRAKNRELNLDFLALDDSVSEITEDESDKCMIDLMGAQIEEDSRKCVISEECWEIMSKHGTKDYYLTHQALFFILADVQDCTHVLQEKYHYDMSSQFTHLVTNIFGQMLNTFKKGLLDDNDLDLFLEQSLLCKWLGGSRCLRLEWLEPVLQWQHSSGCVKGRSEEDDQMINRHSPNMRKLMLEEVTTDGCLSHTSGLFIAHVSAVVHWLVTEYEEEDRQFFFTNIFSVKTMWYVLAVLCVCWIWKSARRYLVFRRRCFSLC